MINKHNLKMNGLKKASGNTVNWKPYSGGHVQINYDMVTGDIFTSEHIGNSWTQYNNRDIISICHTSRHMTMQEIADRIAAEVAEVKAFEEFAKVYYE